MGDPPDPAVATGETTADASPLIPNLLDDLSVQCIARVPRSSHPALKLVSRSWRCLLRSRRLFTARSQLGTTEPSLCINICNYYGESRWYFLNLHPCRLFPLPPNPFSTYGSGCAVLGSSLYALGGYHPDNPLPLNYSSSIPSSAVQIFDPFLNLWTTGPPMREPRKFPAASVLRGRIYVVGGCVCSSQPWADASDPESGAWAEVLDPAAGAWASLPRRPPHLRNKFVLRGSIFGGQLLLDGGLLLDPEAAQPWGIMPKSLSSKWAGQAVVLDGVLYSYSLVGKLEGYDPEAGVWRPVEGVEGELPGDLHCAELTNLGGMLCLVWVQRIKNDRQEIRPSMRKKFAQLQLITPDLCIESVIHCVGVEITRTSGGGFQGSIAWQEVVAMPISDGVLMHSVVLEF